MLSGREAKLGDGEVGKAGDGRGGERRSRVGSG